MKLRYIFLLTLTVSLSSAYGSEKRDFFCGVDTFSMDQHWVYGNEKKFTANVEEWNGEYAQTSGVIKLKDNYEVVIDVKWEAETLNNDDISTTPDPKITLESRIQKSGASGVVTVQSHVV